MWLDETFGLKYPLIQGGMAQVATAEFAAAVSEAGALGVIGTGAMPAWAVEEAINRVRELTDRPFGVNIMLLNPEADAIAELLARERVPLVTTGAGSPGKYIPMWHEAGIRVIPVVASLGLAERMQRIEVDAVIAEGQEAGGHIGEATSMVLWPLLSSKLDIPVIAAGGLATGAQLLAAEILGAQGYQLGTLMLSAAECPIHENYRKALLEATDSRITVLGREQGMPSRVLKNRLARQYTARSRAGADKMELEEMMLGALRRAVKDGDVENGAVMLGQVAAQIDCIRPLAELLATLFEEKEACRAALCKG